MMGAGVKEEKDGFIPRMRLDWVRSRTALEAVRWLCSIDIRGTCVGLAGLD